MLTAALGLGPLEQQQQRAVAKETKPRVVSLREGPSLRSHRSYYTRLLRVNTAHARRRAQRRVHAETAARARPPENTSLANLTQWNLYKRFF